MSPGWRRPPAETVYRMRCARSLFLLCCDDAEPDDVVTDLRVRVRERLVELAAARNDPVAVNVELLLLLVQQLTDPRRDRLPLGVAAGFRPDVDGDGHFPAKPRMVVVLNRQVVTDADVWMLGAFRDLIPHAAGGQRGQGGVTGQPLVESCLERVDRRLRDHLPSSFRPCLTISPTRSGNRLRDSSAAGAANGCSGVSDVPCSTKVLCRAVATARPSSPSRSA